MQHTVISLWQREKPLLVILTLLFVVVLCIGVDPFVVVESSDVDVCGLIPGLHILLLMLILIVAVLDCNILFSLSRLLLAINDSDLLLVLIVLLVGDGSAVSCVVILELLLFLL